MKTITLVIIFNLVILNSLFSQGWYNQASGVSNNLVSVYFINSLTGWACGENGKILKTTNGGTNWVQQTSPASNAHVSISFPDASTGYISGTFGTVIKTTNGGINWTLLNTGVSGALRIHFVNPNTGWVVGAAGTILITTNGGTNWTLQTSGTSSFLLKLHFYDVNTGWVCGAGGVMIKTTNGGTNWNAQTTGSNETLYGLHFVNSQTGWTTGDNGNIYNTTNGGANWTAQSAGATDAFYSVFFTNTSAGWISGDNGKIYFTYNGGANWSQQVTSTTETFYSVSFTSSNTGWAVGTTGKILATTTGGVTVPTAPILSSPANNSTGISLTPSLQWFLVIGAQTYHLMLSTDSLFSTTLINDSTLTVTSYNVPNGLLQNNVRYYWRVRAKGLSGYGPNSSRWNFTTGMVGIQQTGNEIPGEFKLYNNYPNPFNPATKIRFAIPSNVNTNVKLIIFDILGREVKTLVNEQLQSGSYEVEFDGSNLSSGTYFYRLLVTDASASLSTGYSDVKKMVLIK